MDPYLCGVKYTNTVRSLTGFSGAVRIGYFGEGRKVQGGTVLSVLMAVAKNTTLVQKEDLLNKASGAGLLLAADFADAGRFQ